MARAMTMSKMSDHEIAVTLLYSLILNRVPELPAFRNYVTLLDSKENDFLTVFSMFMNAEERRLLLESNPYYLAKLPVFLASPQEALAVLQRYFNSERLEMSTGEFDYLAGEIACLEENWPRAAAYFSNFQRLQEHQISGSIRGLYVSTRNDPVPAYKEKLEAVRQNFSDLKDFSPAIPCQSENLLELEEDLIAGLVSGKGGINEFRQHRKSLLSSPSILADSLAEYIQENFCKLSRHEIAGLFETFLTLRAYSPAARELCKESMRLILDIDRHAIDHSQNRRSNPISRMAKRAYLAILSSLHFGKQSSRNDLLTSVPLDLGKLDDKFDKFVFVGGFQFSGSSAIYDYFRGHSALTDGFPQSAFPNQGEREITFIQNSDGLSELFSLTSMSKEIDPKILLSFFFKYILSALIPTDVHSQNIRREYAIVSGFTANESKFKDYLNVVNHFIEGVANNSRTDGGISPLIFHIRKFLCLLASVLAGIEISKPILLNNALQAVHLHGLRCFPIGTHYIAVRRDPRDQYLSRYSRLGDLNDPDKFIAILSLWHAKYEEQRKLLKSDYNFIDVEFEKFLLSAEYRAGICSALGIPYQEESPFFSPEASRKNIGRHKDFPDQAVMQKIAMAFPEHLQFCH